MVWVVCSGVIPPYNSGGGGGGAQMLPVRTSNILLLVESVCFCLVLYLVIAG